MDVLDPVLKDVAKPDQRGQMNAPAAAGSSTSCLRSIDRLVSLVGWTLTCPLSPMREVPLPPSRDFVHLGGVDDVQASPTSCGERGRGIA